MYKKALFIFRRDLTLDDNIGLLHAIKESERVIPCFIFDPRQIDDPAVNNGNWQWAASTDCDAQPYFRIFNPWLQQKKFDDQCEYIKKWIPELKNIPPKIIHTWLKSAKQINIDYPTLIVDHTKETALAKKLYKASQI